MANELHTIKIGDSQFLLRPIKLSADNPVLSIPSTSTSPLGYKNEFIFRGVKSSASINAPEKCNEDGGYNHVIGFGGAPDGSPTISHEFLLNQIGGMYRRTGDVGNGWQPWVQILDSSNYTSYFNVLNKGVTLTPGGTTTIATINGTDITVGLPNVSSGDGEMTADGVLSNVIADEGGNGEVVFNRTILGPIYGDLSHTHDTLEVESDGFYITDSYNNVVAKIDNAGIDSIDLKVNGQSVNNLINVTYSELKSLRNNGQLYPGRQYRITDYVTTTTQENTVSAGHQFDIIVTADSENTLNEVARATPHEGDTYFATSDLNAWEIWYCLDNDTDKFAWADENGKGVIYRMIDER